MNIKKIKENYKSYFNIIII